jgi:cyanophycin synthetase
MAKSGLVVGMTTSDGIYIGGHCIERGDTTGPQSARAVLFDPTVEYAALETARGGILRRGLGYDWSDVGVLTNIDADHLGQDGLQTVDDLLWAKMLVAERVREGGTLVLNAEDPRLAALPRHPRVARRAKRVAFFSLDPAHPVLARHLAAGGVGYTIDRGFLVEWMGSTEERILRADEIPAALGGAATFQIANALAAAAACRAHGVALGTIAAALRSFGAAPATSLDLGLGAWDARRQDHDKAA